MANNNLNYDSIQLGEEIRKQGGQGEPTMSDLVFDEQKGEFVIASSQNMMTGGIIVTEMTKDGFA